MAGARHALIRGRKVKGQGHWVIKCTAGVGLQVNMTGSVVTVGFILLYGVPNMAMGWIGQHVGWVELRILIITVGCVGLGQVSAARGFSDW